MNYEDELNVCPTETTGSVIVQEIRNGLAEGRYKPGEKIKEADLCRQLGVSRTPVREAFRQLQNEGLLIYIPRRGVQVPQFNMEEIMNVLQVRSALEILSAQNAAAFATESDIKLLRETNNKIKHYNKEHPQRTDILDREFHLIIARIGNNPYVAELLQNTMTRYELASYIIPFQEERIPHTYKEHEDIIRALELKDAKLAKQYMSIHFHYSMLSLNKKIHKYVEEHSHKKKTSALSVQSAMEEDVILDPSGI